MSTFNLTIDGKVCSAAAGETVLTVAKRNGIEIPTLCYHPSVALYGACGVCLVEAEGSPKLMRACATEVRENMVINTKSERAEQGRKLALELLLSDHRGDCRPPCVEACPAQTDCQGYVGLIANGEYQEALKLVKDVVPLPASIGRVCPHPCETACRRKLVEEPVAIAQLKAFVADLDLKSEETFLADKAPASGKKIAVIGGGPAGLTAAYFLARHGHSPEIFEAMPKAGGMLRYGIPQYRLPKDILDQEIAIIEKMGVTFHYNTRIGKDILFEELEAKFDAVYVAIGAWKSAPMRCEGEDSEGVLGGIDFLIDVAQNKPVNMGKRVAVVGGGNTAMDACRTAMRLGAEKVYVLYRRTQAEMPAEEIEITEAMEEGVVFKFLVAPMEVVVQDGKVSAIKLQQMELGEADASGRRRPVPIEGAIETLELDTIIAAIGQKVVPDGIPVALTDWNTIAADEYTFLTDRKGVFAGGDGINDGPGIAISAVAHARKAADVIDSYLKGDMVPYTKPYVVTRQDMTEEDFVDRAKVPRAVMAHLSPEERKRNFKEVNFGFTEEQAKAEASRCLECGCADYFECKLIHYGQQYKVEPQRFAGFTRKREEKDAHPYIERNADKCVLCGLCVRVCEEVVGTSALGLVNRGFDTIVKPEFGTPLKETDCISCGQCVNLCPTGALTEKWPTGKRVPLREEETPSVCGYCSLGCKTNVATKGQTLCRTLPRDDGKLCVMGRFGHGAQDENRLIAPLARGNQKNLTMEDAIDLWKNKMADVVARYGENTIGVAVSDKLTCEEIAMVQSIAKDVLKTDVVASLGKKPSAMEMIFGTDGSTASIDDIKDADFILYVGGDLMKLHPVLGMELRKAQGALALVSHETSLLDDDADMVFNGGYDCGLRKTAAALLKAVDAKAMAGYEDFVTSLGEVESDEASDALAKALVAAKRPLLIYDEGSCTVETAKLLCDIALLIGCEKVLELKPNCNSMGLSQMGVKDREALLASLPKLRGLFVVGETEDLATEHLEYLAVMDTHVTALCDKADLSLPLASFLETQGTVVNCEGKSQQLHGVRKPLSGMSNQEVFAQLGGVLPAQNCGIKSQGTEQRKFEAVAAAPCFEEPLATNHSKTMVKAPLE